MKKKIPVPHLSVVINEDAISTALEMLGPQKDGRGNGVTIEPASLSQAMLEFWDSRSARDCREKTAHSPPQRFSIGKTQSWRGTFTFLSINLDTFHRHIIYMF